MLNKEICRKCHEKVFAPSHNYIYEFFDSNWNFKKVLCPCEIKFINIEDMPPEKCPYLLEQLLKGIEK